MILEKKLEMENEIEEIFADDSVTDYCNFTEIKPNHLELAIKLGSCEILNYILNHTNSSIDYFKTYEFEAKIDELDKYFVDMKRINATGSRIFILTEVFTGNLLHFAVVHNSKSLLKTVLKYGNYTCNEINRTGQTPLHLFRDLMITGFSKLYNNENVNSEDSFGYTPLHYFVSRNQLNAVKYLISRNESLSKQVSDNPQKYRPIHMACISDGIGYHMLKYLLAFEEMEIVKSDLTSPLYTYCKYGVFNLAKLILIIEKSRSTLYNLYMGENIMHLLVRENLIEHAKVFLEYFKIGEIFNSEKKIPIELCTTREMFDVMSQLRTIFKYEYNADGKVVKII